VILVAMAVPAAETLIRMEDTRDSELTIKVTGYQWRWHYDYIDDGVRFFSTLDRESNAARRLDSGIDPNTVDNYLLKVDNEVVVPINTKVRLLITGADVLHAWWVPALAVKKDAVPGFINESWFTADTAGTYRGQCAELCGMDHGFMPIVVRVASQEDYDSWLNSQRAEVSSLASQ
jgi:cytochrome c oxidase subunit 2